MMIAVGAALYLPAAWHTYTATNVFSPFGITSITKLYKKSDCIEIEIKYLDTGDRQEWGSPSFFSKSPLNPFFEYETW